MRCEDLSERLPQLAAGAEWTAGESAHLAGCPACADEWAIVQAGRGLGANGPQLDSTKVATQVLARLRVEPTMAGPVAPPTARRARWIGLGLAAAAVLTLAIGLGREPRQLDPEPAATATETMLTELEGLTSAELEEIMAQLEVDNLGSVSDPGLTDLTNEELERLLRSWEG
ncbi:MAG: hypothetical protein ACYC2K_03540 [Gemmatimonadales bacterium]